WSYGRQDSNHDRLVRTTYVELLGVSWPHAMNESIVARPEVQPEGTADLRIDEFLRGLRFGDLKEQLLVGVPVVGLLEVGKALEVDLVLRDSEANPDLVLVVVDAGGVARLVV